MTTTGTDALSERIAAKARQALDEGEAMQCTRAWEAWHYGTMTDEDFVDASDGPLAEEVAAAVLAIVAEEVRKARVEASRGALDGLIADKAHMAVLLRAENGGNVEDVIAHYRDTYHPEEGQ